MPTDSQNNTSKNKPKDLKTRVKEFFLSLRVSRKSPEGKKGWFLKSTWKFLLVIFFLSGCAYHKTSKITIEGNGLKYPMGISSIKGDVVKVTIERVVKIGK